MALAWHSELGQNEHGHASDLERQTWFGRMRIRDEGTRDALRRLWRAIESERDLVKSEELEAMRKEAARNRR